MPGLDSDLEAALQATAASFHVRLIGTFQPDLVWAPAEASADEWLRQNCPEFDQFPVRDEDTTVGALRRNGSHRGKTVREAMDPLHERLIVSADTPIADLIPQFRDHHFRLVLRGNRIDGLVTQSDLLKLPTRMLVFGLLNHLELTLREVVRRRSPWPAWIDALKSERRTKIARQLSDLKKSRFEPDPLELTDFGDLLRILERCAEPDDDFGHGHRIRKLRNDVAHAKSYITSAEDVKEFVECFESVQRWIARSGGKV